MTKKPALKITLLYLAKAAMLTFIFANFAYAQETRTTVSNSKESVSLSALNARINEAAENYKEYAPIPRGVFFDIGYPKDKKEFDELNGYGLMLVTAISQNQSELPLKRVYVIADGKEIELKPFKTFSSKISGDSQTTKTFGSNRSDVLYLFPIYLRLQKAAVLVDFAKNRDKMKIVEFDENDVPASNKWMPNRRPDEKVSIDTALERFTKREYPMFLQQ